MRIWGLSDLHLAFSSDKPMDVFGDHWAGHADKMAAAWDAWAARVGVEPWAHDIPEGSGSSPTGKKKSARGE